MSEIWLVLSLLGLIFQTYANNQLVLNKDCNLLKNKYIDKPISNIRALNNSIVYKNFE